MSKTVSDADRVRSNTANKEELSLHNSRTNEDAQIGTSFGGTGTISCQKYEAAAKKSAFYNSKALWR